MKLKSTIIVPTYNRKEDLTTCIKSILKQTEKPYELIVVDDGNLASPPLKAECEAAGIRYVYTKKSKPGLTESRNEGVRISKGNIIFFFDDDATIEPDYVAEIMKLFRDDKDGKIGGATGQLTNPPLSFKSHLRSFVDWFFMTESLSEGMVRPSGFSTPVGWTAFPSKGLKDVQILPGSGMTFRKKIFKEFKFTEGFHNVCYGEDRDFSYAVGEKYRLVLVPKALTSHYPSTSMRPDHRKLSKLLITGDYVFFRKFIAKHWWNWLFFIYALFGYTLIRLVALVVFPNKGKIEQMKGLADAVGDIIFGRIDKKLFKK